MRKVLHLMLVGVALLILVAPGRGSETWEKLSKSFKDWKDGVMAQLSDK